MPRADIKKKVEKEQPKKADVKVPASDLFQQKVNEPILLIPPDELQNILSVFNASNEFETVALECYEDQIQIISHNATSTCIAHYIGQPKGSKIEKVGYFILQVKKVLEAIGRKYKDSEMLRLSWKRGDKIIITDEHGNPVEMAPQDIENLHIPDDLNRPKFDGERLQYKVRENGKVLMEDGQPVYHDAKSLIKIDATELMKGSNDMDIAGVDYIVYHFEDDDCHCSAGIWDPTGDTSRTDGLECEIEGAPLEKGLPKFTLSLLKLMSGVVHIQGEQSKKPVVFSQFGETGDIHYMVMENKHKEK